MSVKDVTCKIRRMLDDDDHLLWLSIRDFEDLPDGWGRLSATRRQLQHGGRRNERMPTRRQVQRGGRCNKHNQRLATCRHSEGQMQVMQASAKMPQADKPRRHVTSQVEVFRKRK